MPSNLRVEIMQHEIPGKPCETVGADISTINNKHYLCIVEYHSKFPVMKQVEGFRPDNLIKPPKIFFFKYGLPSR